MKINVDIISLRSILDVTIYFWTYNFRNNYIYIEKMGSKWSTLHKTKPNEKI